MIFGQVAFPLFKRDTFNFLKYVDQHPNVYTYCTLKEIPQRTERTYANPKRACALVIK